MSNTKVVLITGRVGSGKTHMARRMAQELPAPDGDDALALAWLLYGTRMSEHGRLPESAPFRAPHHSVSTLGLVGGGIPNRPGEVSLAHAGCLLLDELPNFRKSLLEELARTIKVGQCNFTSKDGSRWSVPAKPNLIIATADLCPCGRLGWPDRCSCTKEAIDNWNARLLEYSNIIGVTEIIKIDH